MKRKRSTEERSSRKKAKHQVRKIVLVTDIGRDVDDTVALLLLGGHLMVSRDDLVGVVATGGAEVQRACAARGWMRTMGMPDTIPVAVAQARPAGRSTADDEHVVLSNQPTKEDAAVLQGRHAARDLLVDLAERHGRELIVVCIAPMSAIAHALATARGRAALKGICAIYVQGQAEQGCGGRLVPTTDGFNLREDMPAARRVFSALQRFVPFYLLGKHTAYKINLTRTDFERFDAAIPSMGILAAARGNMDVFRTYNPEAFYTLYGVPEDKRNDAEWFDHVACVSHPYDPLLVALMLEPSLFEMNTCVGRAGVIHRSVGQRADEHNVADLEGLHAFVCDLVTAGCRRAVS